MRNTRSLEELYLLLYKFYEENKGMIFICNTMHKMYSKDIINGYELNKLLSNFNKNRPTKDLHSEFYVHSQHHDHTNNWFGSIPKVSDIRAKFIKHLIKHHIE